MRAYHWEGTLHAYAIAYFANGEAGGGTIALTLDHIAFEALDTGLVTFNYFIVNGDVITCFELRKFPGGSQLLVYEVDSLLVHGSNF